MIESTVNGTQENLRMADGRYVTKVVNGKQYYVVGYIDIYYV